MFSNPLIAQDLVSIIQAERRSDAARFRRLAQFLSGPDDADEQGALRLVSSPRPDSADLAGWLEQSGRALAEIPPNQLQDAARRSLYALVVELLEAVRDHGVEIAVTVDPGDPSALLLRAHGALAMRTTGRSIPVSEERRRRLQSILNTILGRSDLIGPNAEYRRAA